MEAFKGSRSNSRSMPASQISGRPNKAVGSVEVIDWKSEMPRPSALNPPAQLNGFSISI